MFRKVFPVAAIVTALAAALLIAQQPGQPPAPQTPRTPKIEDAIVQKGAPETTDDGVEYICPMDPDVRQKNPGRCPKCGMTLVPGLPDPHEYPLQLTTTPRVLKANQKTELHFRIEDPITNKPVTDYVIMHEKLYHLFVVSQDTMFFNHVHPIKQPDGSFILDETFPHPGLYRVLSDFYPDGGTPQLIASTVMVPGEGFKIEPAKLSADMKPKHDVNINAELVTDPAEPIAGFKTLMFFKLTPDDHIEQYIGAWGHMLVASSDLIDMIHTHPAYEPTDPDNGAYKQIQFNMIFPRAGIYKVWVQFQREGKVNTVAFNIPLKNLGE